MGRGISRWDSGPVTQPQGNSGHRKTFQSHPKMAEFRISHTALWMWGPMAAKAIPTGAYSWRLSAGTLPIAGPASPLLEGQLAVCHNTHPRSYHPFKSKSSFHLPSNLCHVGALKTTLWFQAPFSMRSSKSISDFRTHNLIHIIYPIQFCDFPQRKAIKGKKEKEKTKKHWLLKSIKKISY